MSSPITNHPAPYGLREVLYDWLTLLNPSHLTYYSLAVLCFCGLLLLTFKAEQVRFERKDFFYGFSVFLFILSCKWPDLFRAELNPDESFCLAIASKLIEDPIYWRSAVGATHGPLLHLPPLVPHFFGLSMDYASLRLTAMLIFSLTFVLNVKTFELFFNKTISRAAILPFVVIYAMASSGDFGAYHGAHVASLCLALCLYWAARLSADNISSLKRSTFIFGFCLGLMPFSKIQGVPIAIAAAVAGICVILVRLSNSRSEAIKTIGILIFACLLFPAALISLVSYHGAFEEFWVSYILHNMAYGTRSDLSLIGKAAFYLSNLFSVHIEIPEMIIGQFFTCLIAAAILFHNRKKIKKRQWALLLTALAFLPICLFCVIMPGNFFSHYSLFLFLPFSMLFAALLGISLSLQSAARYKYFTFGSLISCALILPFSRIAIRSERPFVLPAQVSSTINQENPAKILRALTSAREPLVIWGWADHLYQQSDLYPGTRYPSIYVVQQMNPYIDYFRNQFVSDFIKSKAPVFIDAIGKDRFGGSDRSRDGHETIPALFEEVKANYILLVDIENIRIYVRNDRWSEIRKRANSKPAIIETAKAALEIMHPSEIENYKKELSKKKVRSRYFDHAFAALASLKAAGTLPSPEHDATLALALAYLNDANS